MKNKIFEVVIALISIITLISLTGCGKKDDDVLNDTNNKQNNIQESEEESVIINNNSLENTVIGYYTELYDNKDTKTAYQYYDNMGLYTWKSLNLGTSSVKSDNLSDFIETYNQNKADEELQNKLNAFIEDTYTDSFYEELDEEVEHNQANIVGNKNYEVEIEVKETKEVVTGVYYAAATVTYRFDNGNGYGGDKRHIYLIENDNKYYIINSGPRYDEEFSVSKIKNYQ